MGRREARLGASHYEMSWDPDTSRLRNVVVSRRMPSLLIRLRSVFGCMFSRTAAPRGPSTTQPVFRSVATMWERSTSSSVPDDGSADTDGPDCVLVAAVPGTVGS